MGISFFYMSINSLIDKSNSDALNVIKPDDWHCVFNGGFTESDADEEVIFNIKFKEFTKITKIRLQLSPAMKEDKTYPQTLYIFVGGKQPLNFCDCEDVAFMGFPLDLDSSEFEFDLKNFKSSERISLYFKDNFADSERTSIPSIQLIGSSQAEKLDMK